MYCTECGKKLQSVHVYGKKTFDRETGDPIYRKMTVFQCPDYVEGFSDREWHAHDRYTTEQIVNDIDGLTTHGPMTIW